MQKIRSNAALLVVLIGVAMVAFILSDMFNKGGASRAQQEPVGEIFGEKIMPDEMFEEFQSNLESQGNPSDPDSRGNVWNTSWSYLINRKLYDREFKSCGLALTEKELIGIISNPPPGSELLMIPTFKNQQTQQYDPAVVFQYLDQARQIEVPANEQEQQLVDYMKRIENYLYYSRYQNKYYQMVRKAAFVSKKEAERNYNEMNEKRSFKYVFVSYATISDSSVTVTDEELKAYYNDHKEMYKREEEEVDLRYVYFEKLPAAQDTQIAMDYLNKQVENFRTAKNDTSFVMKFQGVFDTTWAPVGALPAGLLSRAGEIAPGAVIGPVLSDKGFTLFKVREVRDGADPAIRVRHIQYNFSMPPSAEDSAKAKQRANDQKATLTSANFADAAGINSEDAETKTKGGEVGWITFPSKYGEAYDKAVKNAPVGSFVVAMVNGGYVVAEIEDRSTRQVKYSSISREIFAGTATIKNIYQKASRFAGEVEQAGSIEEAAKKSQGINVRKTPEPIRPGTISVLGIVGAQPLITFALKGEVGDRTKEILETDNAFVIAEIADRREKGYQQLKEIEQTIRANALNRKKAKQIIEKLTAVPATNLEQVAQSYGGGIAVQEAKEILFSGSYQPPLGSEPKVVGRVFGLTPNEISKPVVGTMGVYMVQLTEVIPPAAPNDQILAGTKGSLKSSKETFLASKPMEAMKELAKIVDLRRNMNY